MGLLGAIGKGLNILGAGMDLAAGDRARKRQEALQKQFYEGLARDREEALGLERIARGEVLTTLADTRQLFQRVTRAISATGSADGRRLLEMAARREAEEAQRIRSRGLGGSTAGATMQAIQERQSFRSLLDAGANRSSAVAQALGNQASIEAGIRGQVAQSYRSEADMIRRFGSEEREALQNTRVGFTPVSSAFGVLAAELGNLDAKRGEMATVRAEADMNAKIQEQSMENVRAQAGMDAIVNRMRQDAAFRTADFGRRIIQGLL